MRTYQRNGRWYFEGMIRGIRYHKSIPEAVTKKDAEDCVNCFKADLLRGRFDLVDNKGCMLFSKLVDEYTKYTQTNNKSFKCNISKALRFKDLWGNRQIKNISTMDIEKYKITRLKDIKAKEKTVNGKLIPAKTISKTTVNRDIEVLRRMFNIAIENDWLDKNPCNNVKKLRQDNKLERFLSKEEEQKLLNCCTDIYSHLKNIIIFALNTGARKNEILGLTWECINFNDRKITLLETKNGKKRYVPINDKLLFILKSLYNNKLSEFVFTNPETGTRYSDLKRSFVSVCKKADVKNFRFHDLRHTAATRMVNCGANLITVKEILGHSDIRTTMRYAHAITKEKLNAVELLANF